jgi:hypothetical protein
MEEGMNLLGSMVLMGNVPCVRCGFGDTCSGSGVKMLHGQDATVESVGISDIDTDPAKTEEAEELGRRLREAVDAMEAQAEAN